MTTPEGLTREEREQYWRERSIARFEGDPEMQQILREARFDYEATPEENAEDIRISKERENSPTIPIEVVLEKLALELAEAFPEDADYYLNWK